MGISSYTGTVQPIIRGIQAVGAVELRYLYNGRYLTLPSGLMFVHGGGMTIDTKGNGNGVRCAGFRLDSEFLRASPQIASSFMIPILGGGAVALTNNNRSGTLALRTTKVSTPSWGGDTVNFNVYRKETTVDADGNTQEGEAVKYGTQAVTLGNAGMMFTDGSSGIGVSDNTDEKHPENYVYDITTLLQAQQAQEGGDDVGSTIMLAYKFNGLVTALTFEGCTVANIDPIGLAGNDAVDYNASINYLNWRVNMSDESDAPFSQLKTAGNIKAIGD